MNRITYRRGLPPGLSSSLSSVNSSYYDGTLQSLTAGDSSDGGLGWLFSRRDPKFATVRRYEKKAVYGHYPMRYNVMTAGGARKFRKKFKGQRGHQNTWHVVHHRTLAPAVQHKEVRYHTIPAARGHHTIRVHRREVHGGGSGGGGPRVRQTEGLRRVLSDVGDFVSRWEVHRRGGAAGHHHHVRRRRRRTAAAQQKQMDFYRVVKLKHYRPPHLQTTGTARYAINVNMKRVEPTIRSAIERLVQKRIHTKKHLEGKRVKVARKQQQQEYESEDGGLRSKAKREERLQHLGPRVIREDVYDGSFGVELRHIQPHGEKVYGRRGTETRPVERHEHVRRDFGHDWGVQLQAVQPRTARVHEKKFGHDWDVTLGPVQHHGRFGEPASDRPAWAAMEHRLHEVHRLTSGGASKHHTLPPKSDSDKSYERHLGAQVQAHVHHPHTEKNYKSDGHHETLLGVQTPVMPPEGSGEEMDDSYRRVSVAHAVAEDEVEGSDGDYTRYSVPRTPRGMTKQGESRDSSSHESLVERRPSTTEEEEEDDTDEEVSVKGKSRSSGAIDRRGGTTEEESDKGESEEPGGFRGFEATLGHGSMIEESEEENEGELSVSVKVGEGGSGRSTPEAGNGDVKQEVKDWNVTLHYDAADSSDEEYTEERGKWWRKAYRKLQNVMKVTRRQPEDHGAAWQSTFLSQSPTDGEEDRSTGQQQHDPMSRAVRPDLAAPTAFGAASQRHHTVRAVLPASHFGPQVMHDTRRRSSTTSSRSSKSSRVRQSPERERSWFQSRLEQQGSEGDLSDGHSPSQKSLDSGLGAANEARSSDSSLYPPSDHIRQQTSSERFDVRDASHLKSLNRSRPSASLSEGNDGHESSVGNLNRSRAVPRRVPLVMDASQLSP